MTRNAKRAAYLCGILAMVCLPGERASAEQSFTARALVEKNEVFVGESFTFQIVIDGHDAPETPDVRAIEGFTVQPLGGQQNSSTSINIVNGRMSQVVRRGYVFSYSLAATRPGILTIPSISVMAQGRTAETRPVRVSVSKPTEVDDFHLLFSLSPKTCYVGQPVTLTVTWYIGQNVEGFDFSLPVLNDERFDLADVRVSIDPSQQDSYLSIPLPGGEVVAKKSRSSYKGKEYLSVAFQKILIPLEAGSLKIPQGTVACNAVVGYENRRRRSLFDDVWGDSFFGRGKQAVVRKLVVPSNEPPLTVRPLPEAGRPVGFTGLVGKYRIAAQAEPTEARVGDPITVTITVSGPDYLDNVDLPPLDKQPVLAENFKIPAEMAPGKVEGATKTFTQTLRAKHDRVGAIPPIELPYFDSELGTYRIARSEPIALRVTSTRIVTAQDAEGRVGVENLKSDIETRLEGIAHNYEDPSVLIDQSSGPAGWLNSPGWMALLGAPPFLYVLLLGSMTLHRRRNANPQARKARRALRELLRSLDAKTKAAPADASPAHGAVLEALRIYLGSKLELSPGALTYNDVKDALSAKGADDAVLRRLKGLFEELEAMQYAGACASGAHGPELIERTRSLAAELERSLG